MIVNMKVCKYTIVCIVVCEGVCVCMRALCAYGYIYEEKRAYMSIRRDVCKYMVICMMSICLYVCVCMFVSMILCKYTIVCIFVHGGVCVGVCWLVGWLVFMAYQPL